MSVSVSVIGSTGLIGSHFLASLSENDFSEVTALSRRPIESLLEQSFIKQAIHDFSEPATMEPDLHCDILVCALGTTIKTAGSQQRFSEIDHDLPLELARLAKDAGCRSFILISSVGADPESRVFYSRVKGQLEQDLATLGFEQLHILRPSMLLGDRLEKRPGEFIGKLIMTPLRFLIPWKYKPIHANIVSRAILKLCRSQQVGLHIHEGRDLFHPE